MLLDGSANGMTRPSAWPWAGLAAGRGGRIAVQLVAQGGPLLVGHHAEVGGRRRAPRRRCSAVVTRFWISLRSGQPATVRVTSSDTESPPDLDVAHHVQVDDRAVELGVLDGAKGGDDVVDGDGHRFGRTGFRSRADFHYGA